MSEITQNKLFQMAQQETIVVPISLENRIDNLLNDLPSQKHFYKMNLRKALVLAAVLIMAFSITATAAVSILQQRMEAMNRDKLEEFFVQIYQSKLPADNYNRAITQEEQARIDSLKTAYAEHGLFPEKELTLIQKADAYNGKNVAYLADTGTFFLPDKEMTDEQLLQIIDFRTKRDYSLQKMNEMIESGEVDFPEEAIASNEPIVTTDEAILQSDAVWNPEQELTIPYTGELSVCDIGAGNNSIFLGGFNSIHQMEIGSSDSEVFYDDFTAETRILEVYQATNDVVYATGWEWVDSGETHLYLWMIDSKGSLIRKIDLKPYCGSDGNGIIGRIAVDTMGNIYLSGQLAEPDNEVLVLDQNGALITKINTENYHTSRLGGLGIGKDGLAYITVMDQDWNMGIASIDVDKGALGTVYPSIVPPETIMLDVVAAGSDTDFVFWGFDGIFTYNLGDEHAINVLPAYEAPCQWEGVLYCALPDGRIVFADSTDYTKVEAPNGGERYLAIPEKTTFYYISTMNREEK